MTRVLFQNHYAIITFLQPFITLCMVTNEIFYDCCPTSISVSCIYAYTCSYLWEIIVLYCLWMISCIDKRKVRYLSLYLLNLLSSVDLCEVHVSAMWHFTQLLNLYYQIYTIYSALCTSVKCRPQLCDTVQYGCQLKNLYYWIYAIYSALWVSLKCRSQLCDAMWHVHQLSVPGSSKWTLSMRLCKVWHLPMTSNGSIAV